MCDGQAMSEGASTIRPRGSQDEFGRIESWDDARAESWVEALDLRAAGADQTRLREEILALARPGTGDTAVEIGCGTGPLLAQLAEAVGEAGRVIGIEPQPVLARAARRRITPVAERCEIRVERGIETTLADGIADVCVAQTVLCHLPEAECEGTLARMLRLTRRGGRIVSADQDAETWVVDHPDRAVTRRLVAFYADQRFADGWTGRRLRSLFLRAGLVEVETRALVVVDTSVESYGFRIAIDRARAAARAEWITERELDAWVRALQDEAAAGRFFSSLNFYVAAGTVA
jgi:ubiquinone/menaquinone biosynthesis C-methylase UbiE